MLIKPVTFQVVQIGAHWEVSCSLRDRPRGRHSDRAAALRVAQADALALWQQQSIAAEVVLCEDDGGWHTVMRYGDLLG